MITKDTSGGYVGLRVIGGKNLGNKIVSKVANVRLGSPADLRTSVKPGTPYYIGIIPRD